MRFTYKLQKKKSLTQKVLQKSTFRFLKLTLKIKNGEVTLARWRARGSISSSSKKQNKTQNKNTNNNNKQLHTEEISVESSGLQQSSSKNSVELKNRG